MGDFMNKVVNEIFVLRSIACLAIVFLHSIQSSMINFNMESVASSNFNNILYVIQILMMFGTPMFVFISEFLISYSYPYQTPKTFLVKRFKYILLPFISMGIFYAIVYTLINTENLTLINLLLVSLRNALKNVFLGNYHGYFVLIIFQFYLFHNFFKNYIVKKFSAKFVISVSVIINIIYLGFFNFISPNVFFQDITKEVELIWYVILYRIPLFAWIAYFTIAYYCGANISRFRAFVKKKFVFVHLSTVVTSVLVLTLCVTGILQYIQSKRVDIIFYTISVTFLIFYYSTKFKKVPKLFMHISKYSFAIYLLHPFFQVVVERIINVDFTLLNFLFYLSFVFILGVIGPIIVSYSLNRMKIGPYLIGKVNLSKSKEQNTDKVLAS
jgi:membrane-bound acyltransferase YfiQ involved in biofilm formation